MVNTVNSSSCYLNVLHLLAQHGFATIELTIVDHSVVVKLTLIGDVGELLLFAMRHGLAGYLHWLEPTASTYVFSSSIAAMLYVPKKFLL